MLPLLPPPAQFQRVKHHLLYSPKYSYKAPTNRSVCDLPLISATWHLRTTLSLLASQLQLLHPSGLQATPVPPHRLLDQLLSQLRYLHHLDSTLPSYFSSCYSSPASSLSPPTGYLYPPNSCSASWSVSALLPPPALQPEVYLLQAPAQPPGQPTPTPQPTPAPASGLQAIPVPPHQQDGSQGRLHQQDGSQGRLPQQDCSQGRLPQHDVSQGRLHQQGPVLREAPRPPLARGSAAPTMGPPAVSSPTTALTMGPPAPQHSCSYYNVTSYNSSYNEASCPSTARW